MDKFTELRGQYPTFIYRGFDITNEGFSFDFSIGEFSFRPKLMYTRPELARFNDSPLVRYIVFCIGMVELVSYWKCACPPRVIVQCGALSEEQTLWWKRLYWGGLGEFFYRNGIKTDFDSFMTIECENKSVPRFTDLWEGERRGAVIPVGGGKDSVVTLELLRGMREDNLCYIINPRPTTVDCAHTAGYSDESIVGFTRRIDPELLRRNADGWLNGHTPFSAVVAFTSYLAAVVTGRKYIALSNESSANEGNVSGSDVNHQYSKSTAFERDFRDFCAKWLLPCPGYFSLLRPWTEWQIAKRFVQYPQYFPVFKSCNLGSKSKEWAWCCDCAKGLYVYILLAAFLDDSTLVSIFGTDMLDEPKHRELFRALEDPGQDKPFECVGTRTEIQLALYHAAERRRGGKMPVLLEEYMREEHGKPAELDGYFDSDNFVPEELIGLLRK